MNGKRQCRLYSLLCLSLMLFSCFHLHFYLYLLADIDIVDYVRYTYYIYYDFASVCLRSDWAHGLM